MCLIVKQRNMMCVMLLLLSCVNVLSFNVSCHFFVFFSH